MMSPELIGQLSACAGRGTPPWPFLLTTPVAASVLGLEKDLIFMTLQDTLNTCL
jgi:hypothetical protein